MQQLVQIDDFHSVLERLAASLNHQSATLATAESCTGGLLAFLLTAPAGSSQYFLGSIVAYSNVCKRKLLKVPEAMLQAHGAVSQQVAIAMATGLREATGATYGLSVTGIAGPGGGSAEKPVGTVWVAYATPHRAQADKLSLNGSRHEIRVETAKESLTQLCRIIEESQQ